MPIICDHEILIIQRSAMKLHPCQNNNTLKTGNAYSG